MQKGAKENFIEIPQSSFNRKQYQFPVSIFETRFAPSSKNLVELRKIIQAHGYQCICLMSDERIIFACKSLSKRTISAVQVKELPHSQKSLYLSLNITSCLRSQLRPFFLMKNWRIENKIYLQDQKSNGVALVEYNLAESDLRTYIERKQLEGEKLSIDCIFGIFKQLAESLYSHHLHNKALNDIRPETILLENGRWFLAKGEVSEDISFEYGTVLSRPVTVRSTDKSYLSPILFEAHTRMDQSLTHNPFKSDVYSLGLIMLQLQTVGIWSAQQFKESLQNRKTLASELSNFSLMFREKLIIKGKRIFCIGNILEMMLAQKQADRAFSLEICLQLNFTNIIMSRILVPHQQFFRYDVVSCVGSRHKILYPHVPIEYEGELREGSLVKEGKGIINYNNIKVFEGDWRNNLPDGKCSVNFSEFWKYQGFMKEGRFDGQGFLFFNGTRLNEGKWFNNLSEDRVEITNKDKITLREGYYFFIRSPIKQPQNPKQKDKEENKQYKVFYKQFNSNKKLYVLNLFTIDPKQVISTLIKFLEQASISHISLHQKQQKVLYNCGQYEMIRMKSSTLVYEIQILTAVGQSRPLLMKLFQTDVFKVPLNLNLSNSKLSEDQLRELFEKPVTIEVLNISSCRIADKGLRILSICERTKFLKSLDLSHLQITDKSLSEFIFSKAIQNLEELYLNFCKNLSSQTIATFLCNEKLKKLRRMEIEATSFTHYGLEKVIRFNNFNRLDSINIGLCHKINDAYFIIFLKNKISSSLKNLSINSTILTDNILEVMASPQCKIDALQSMNLSGSINLSFYGLSKLFTSQKVLYIVSINLSGTYIDDEFLNLLAKKSCLTKKTVKQLYMSSCFAISDKGVGEVLRSDNFMNLQVLDISRTFISNDSLYAIADSLTRHFKNLNASKCQKISDSGLEKLIHSQNAKTITTLNLSFSNISSGTFNALAESKTMHSLTSLKLEQCMKIDENSLIKYFKSTNFKSLEYLDLSGTLISNKALEAFNANSYNFYKFIDLDIANCRNITSEGLQHICMPNKFIYYMSQKQQIGKNSLGELAHSEILLKMNTLNLTRQSQKQLPSLFQSQYCCNLNTIAIHDSQLKECFLAMQNSKYMKNLKTLSLKGCEVNEPSLKAFLKSENARSLEELDISWTLLTNQIMFAISQSTYLTFLQSLKITKCININDKGLERFLNSKKCSTLKDLDLRSTLLTNYTLQALANSKFLKTLKKLNLRACPNLKNSGVEQLFKSVNCTTLRSFDFSWTNFTGEMFLHLKNSRYTTDIRDITVSGLKGIQSDLIGYVSSPACSCLKRLDISSCSLSQSAILQILDSQYLQSLEQLDISNIDLDRSCVLAMFKSKNIQKLHRLGMVNILTPADIVKLVNQNWQKLSKLQSVTVASVKNLNQDQIKKHLRNLTFLENRDVRENRENV